MTNSLLDKLKLYKQVLEQKLHEDNFVSNSFGKVESQTGINRIYFAYGIISIFALNLLIGYGAHLLVLAVGVFYPAYRSVKAIETSNKQDDTRWLTYWVVFAFIELTEAVAAVVIYFIPFYNLIKCIFLLYCMAPVRNNGSELLYRLLIQPLVMKNAEHIDSVGDHITGFASDILEKNASNGLYIPYPVVLGDPKTTYDKQLT